MSRLADGIENLQFGMVNPTRKVIDPNLISYLLSFLCIFGNPASGLRSATIARNLCNGVLAPRCLNKDKDPFLQELRKKLFIPFVCLRHFHIHTMAVLFVKHGGTVAVIPLGIHGLQHFINQFSTLIMFSPFQATNRYATLELSYK